MGADKPDLARASFLMYVPSSAEQTVRSPVVSGVQHRQKQILPHPTKKPPVAEERPTEDLSARLYTLAEEFANSPRPQVLPDGAYLFVTPSSFQLTAPITNNRYDSSSYAQDRAERFHEYLRRLARTRTETIGKPLPNGTSKTLADYRRLQSGEVSEQKPEVPRFSYSYNSVHGFVVFPTFKKTQDEVIFGTIEQVVKTDQWSRPTTTERRTYYMPLDHFRRLAAAVGYGVQFKLSH